MGRMFLNWRDGTSGHAGTGSHSRTHGRERVMMWGYDGGAGWWWGFSALYVVL